jgi:hypothetical protein
LGSSIDPRAKVAELLPASRERILATVPEDAVVLDIGGWASPFPRADWVVDLMPYETRGLYDQAVPGSERFTRETWIQRDICDRESLPFEGNAIDFAICSHTLEDVRDPVWVSSELNRVAKAGYIEVPSRLEEQSYGVHGPWVGWSHHRWLVDVMPGRIEFVSKPGVLQGRRDCRFPAGFVDSLQPEERIQTLFWEDRFEFGERIMMTAEELDGYLEEFVAAHLPAAGLGSRLRRRGLGLVRGRRR